MKFIIATIIFVLILLMFILDETITLKPFYEQKGLFRDGVSTTRNLLTEQECATMSNKIAQNEYIEDNPLSEGFDDTRGIIFDFDVNGAQEELSSGNCDYLFDIFKKICKPYANRFIMNVLIIDSENDNSCSKNEMAVDYHYDLTLEDRPTQYMWGIERMYLPECVSVVYIDLPESFEGGELDICSFFYNEPIRTVKPELGMLLEFNGKYLHGVYKMTNVKPKTSRRISVVLEQYST
jgi:hypothetical protein